MHKIIMIKMKMKLKRKKKNMINKINHTKTKIKAKEIMNK